MEYKNQQQFYYNAALYKEAVDKMCKHMEGYLSDTQKMVLADTILLNKHLVENQDIIVAEGITRVCDVLQDFKKYRNRSLAQSK